MKVKRYKELAQQSLIEKGETSTIKEIEEKFWRDIGTESPIYGSDMKGTLFSSDLYHWNLSRLTEQNILKYLAADVNGVTSSYLYFGMWKSMFAWHTEDMDLFSINYLHYGAPKHWYVIPEADRFKFEKYASSMFPEKYNACRQFLRHKTTMIHPSNLIDKDISIYSDVQNEGEFIITFPGAYHTGFNHGFNCAEAVNFGMDSWIQRGQISTVCWCKPDSVYFNMDIFLHNYNIGK